MFRSVMSPTVAPVPLTAGAWVAVWETCPTPQPVSATAVASAHAATPAVTAEVRNLKRFTQASCSAGKDGSLRFNYAQ